MEAEARSAQAAAHAAESAAHAAEAEARAAQAAAHSADLEARDASMAARRIEVSARDEMLAAEQARVDLDARLVHALETNAALDRSRDDDLDHVFRVARALRDRGAAEPAARLTDCVLRALAPSDHDWPRFAYMLASLDAAGNPARALAGFQRVMNESAGADADGFVGGAAFHVARLLVDLGELDSARPYLERCLRLVPDHRAARALFERLARA